MPPTQNVSMDSETYAYIAERAREEDSSFSHALRLLVKLGRVHEKNCIQQMLSDLEEVVNGQETD